MINRTLTLLVFAAQNDDVPGAQRFCAKVPPRQRRALLLDRIDDKSIEHMLIAADRLLGYRMK
jgi:hypothetical protein